MKKRKKINEVTSFWVKKINLWDVRMILVMGSLLGFFSVAFGAFSEHVLRLGVSEEQFRFLGTALRYNQVNAVVVVAIGFAYSFLRG